MPSRVSASVQTVEGPLLRADLHNLLVVDEAGSHLMAKATTKAFPLRAFSEGDPVLLNWGRPGSQYTSTMYVHRVQDNGSRSGGKTSYTLTLVGASWPLKSQNQRVMKNATASSILRDIALDHNLSHAFSGFNREFDLFVSKKSDWATLRDLSDRVGGILRCDSTTVRVLDKNDGLSNLSGAPVYEPSQQGVSSLRVVSRKQDAFRHEATIVNPITREVVTQDDSLRRDSTVSLLTERPVIAAGGSAGSVEQDLRAMRLNDRFREWGEVKGLIADPRMRPGTLIGFAGTTSAKQGYWTIIKAEHSMTETSFLTSMELGRSDDHPRLTLKRPPLITERPAESTPTPRLHRGRWVAA